MPQQIDVPGVGIVEFPDGMDDAAIASAIQANAPAAETPADIPGQQADIVGRMSDEFGGLGAEGGEGTGVSLGEAVRSQPFWAGIGQRFVQAQRGISQLFATKEEAERLATLTAEEAATLKRRFSERPDEAAAFGLGQGTATIGETVTAARYIPAPTKVGLGGTGLAKAAGRVAYSGSVGGGIAATHVTEPGQSKGEQVAGGVAFGALPAALVEGVAAGFRPLASLFATADDAAASGGLLKGNPAYERGLALHAKTGVKLTPGQVSGSPSLSEMRPPKGSAEKQAKQVLRNFVELRDAVSGDPKLPAALAQKFGDTTDDIYRQLVETRRKVGDFRYGQFRQSVKEVYADKLLARMDGIAKDAVPGTDAGKITLLRDKLAKQMDESGGSLTPDQLLGWKERIDALMAGKSDIFKDLSKANQRRLGGQLMDSLYDSLTETASTLALRGELSPATKLKQAVADYKKFSAPIKDLEDSALGAIFRNKDAPMTMEAAGRKLMSLEPTQVKAVYSILDQHRPDLIQQYQATKLYSAMKASVRLTPETAGRLASQTKFQPQVALKELTRKDGLRAVFEQDPALLRRVRNGVALLDRVSDRLSSGSGGRQSVVSREAEIAGNVVSGHPVFIARTAAKVLGPAGLWKLTSTPGGLRTLHALATAPRKSAKFVAAVEDLVMNLDDATDTAE